MRSNSLVFIDEIHPNEFKEIELISLISDIDQYIIELKKKENNNPVLAVKLISEIVNHVIEFSEDKVELERNSELLLGVLQEATESYFQMQIIVVHHNRLSVHTAIELFNRWVGFRHERGELFQHICRGLILMLEYYFSFFTDSFDSPEFLKSWDDMTASLLEDLENIVETIKF